MKTNLHKTDAPICRLRGTNLVSTSGSVVERYTYNAYGKVSIYSANWTAQTSSSYDNNILFAGYRWDKESGLYQVRHRMYNPSLGRWMQRDPMGYIDGLSLYQYARSNPLLFLDQLGLSCIGDGRNNSSWLGWFENEATAFGKGLGQGVLNTVNGVQDIGVGLVNTPGSLYNASLGRLGLGHIPSVPSPDWSKGVLLDKSIYHGLSKVIGGNGAVGLLTTGAGKLLSSIGRAGRVNEATGATSRPFTHRLADIKANSSKWTLESSHSGAALSRRAAGGASEQIIYRNTETGETIVRHRLIDARGRILEDHYRPMYKPRIGESK